MPRKLVHREELGRLIVKTSGAISVIDESNYMVRSTSGNNTYTVIATQSGWERQISFRFEYVYTSNTIHAEAIQYFDKALAVDPNYKDALMDKGYVLGNQGNNDESIKYFDKVLAIDPTDKDALDGKGSALQWQGNDAEAIQYYNKVLAIDPNDKYALDGKQAVLSKMGSATGQVATSGSANSRLATGGSASGSWNRNGQPE